MEGPNVTLTALASLSTPFFKTTYKKYTNFGLQKFRTDFDGLRALRMTESSKFTFRMKRYAELLRVVEKEKRESPRKQKEKRENPWSQKK